MKVYELMYMLKDCPSGDDVKVGGYMNFKELAEAENKNMDRGSLFECLKPAQDVSSDLGITTINF